MLVNLIDEEFGPIPIEDIETQSADRFRAIAQGAYFLAQKRGFAPGHELDDWLAAERHRESWERGCGRDPNWP